MALLFDMRLIEIENLDLEIYRKLIKLKMEPCMEVIKWIVQRDNIVQVVPRWDIDVHKTMLFCLVSKQAAWPMLPSSTSISTSISIYVCLGPIPSFFLSWPQNCQVLVQSQVSNPSRASHQFLFLFLFLSLNLYIFIHAYRRLCVLVG